MPYTSPLKSPESRPIAVWLPESELRFPPCCEVRGLWACGGHAAEKEAALASLTLAREPDCWVQTTALVAGMRACLEEFVARGGKVTEDSFPESTRVMFLFPAQSATQSDFQRVMIYVTRSLTWRRAYVDSHR